MNVELPDGTIIEDIPDDTTKEQLIERLKANGYDISSLEAPVEESAPEQPQEEQPEYPPFGEVRQDVDPDTLSADPAWLEASREIHRMNKGQEWEGTDAELAEYGLDVMGYFNYSMVNANPLSDHSGMGTLAHRVTQSEQRQKEAFLYLMDTYDNLNMSWGGAGRFFKGVASDVTTYVGLGTLGIGTAGATGAKVATKQGLKELLKQGLRVGAVAAVEGGMYAATDDTLRQTVEVSAGRREEIDDLKVAGSAALGATAGLVLGTAADAAVNKALQAFKKMPTENVLPAATPSAAAPDAPSARPDVSTSGTPKVADEGAEKATEAAPEVKAEGGQELAVAAPKEGDAPNLPAEHHAPELEGDFFQYVKLEDLPLPTSKTNIPYERQSLKYNMARAFNLAREFKGMQREELDVVAEQLASQKMTRQEFSDMAMSFKLGRDWVAAERAETIRALQKATKPEDIARLAQKENELGGTFSSMDAIESSLVSYAGYDMRQAQVGLPRKLNDMSPEEFAESVSKAMDDIKVKEKTATYDRQIEAAVAQGDMGEAARLHAMKGMEIDGEIARKLDQMSNKDVGSRTTRGINKAVELFISNVFSPITVLRNAVPPAFKVLTRPAVDALVNNPFEAATRKSMAATYAAMKAGHGGALRAAAAAFKYEQAILTRESGRMLEGELAIKGTKGALIRTLPRILNTTDEYFSQLTYRGFIAGNAAAEAYEAGVKQGLKGKALDRYVKEQSEAAVKNAFSAAGSPESAQVVINKGLNLGYTGERLALYVKTEADKSGEALRHGHDKEAIDFARDMLYKRAPSGKGFASSSAALYEKWVNEWPVIRLFGQLFFRTPLRVFEEGIRMTPGVQILAPHFLTDLAGKGGRRAQVRAQGEALASLGFASGALTLYANGRITGDGAYSDWKQERNRTDSPLPPPYSIIMEDGTAYSYKNLDPIATPLKIMVNAFERMEVLEMKKRQGEFVGKHELDSTFAAVSVGVASIWRAIADANLLGGIAGIEEAIKAGTDDQQGGEAAFIKITGEKLRMLVPNTLHKIAQTNDPTMDDPATWYQMIESKLLGSMPGYEKNVPKSYDALGNVRSNPDLGSMWHMFSGNTLEERYRGMTETQAQVLMKLDHISQQTGATFATPTKHPMLGDVDLRKTYTADGKETLQDRWNRYYRELQPEKLLLPIVESALPTGTFSVNGPKVSEAQFVINQLREAALGKLLAEEAQVEEMFLKNTLRRAEAAAGFWDQ